MLTEACCHVFQLLHTPPQLSDLLLGGFPPGSIFSGCLLFQFVQYGIFIYRNSFGMGRDLIQNKVL